MALLVNRLAVQQYPELCTAHLELEEELQHFEDQVVYDLVWRLRGKSERNGNTKRRAVPPHATPSRGCQKACHARGRGPS